VQQLLLFIYNNRAFFTFVALQLVAMWLIVNQNTYQSFAFLSSSNRIIGGVNNTTGDIANYFDLKDENQRLLRENALLRQQSNNGNRRLSNPDSYRFIPAQVVNNSIRFNNNYLTIDKGAADGIKPGMGVITDLGIVGKVKACSDHFSTVYSLLHTNMEVSSSLQKDGTICATKWNAAQNDYTQANLLYLARHKKLYQGDTIVTSGSNAVFPPDVLIGTIDTVWKDDAKSFLDVQINLSTEFSQLDYVYVIRNKYSAERDSLERISTPDLNN